MTLLSSQQLGTGSAALLIGTVLVVGVLHTMVPDHWIPIALIARQRGWTKRQTARAALQAGTGHVVTTLLLATIVWVAGVAAAAKFGHWVDTISSTALIAFGLWIAISSWVELHGAAGHGHGHGLRGHTHGFSHLAGPDGAGESVHGPERQTFFNKHDTFDLSIYESGQPPRFRFTGTRPETMEAVTVVTCRDDGSQQAYELLRQGSFWESLDDIPEPHGFEVTLTVTRDGHSDTLRTKFAEHAHHQGDQPPLGDHGHHHGTTRKVPSRTALILILGSSPMVEGIPAFFAAGKYGLGLIIPMAGVFAASTILTYVLLCVYSTTSLQRMKFGTLERYGEVLSGTFIAVVGLAFWVFPML